MIRIRNIKVDIKNDDLKSHIDKLLKVKDYDYTLVKKSIDARHKDNIKFIYTVDVNVSMKDVKRKSDDIFETPKEVYNFNITGDKKESFRPVIVGAGPSGLFIAYLLSINGYKPIIIERGEDVESRVDTIENFWKTNDLNTESNVQFGEGGAGTFSDGKLNTLVNDSEFRKKFVLETFVKFGANENILYDAHPHIGTDILRVVVKNMREYIISKGGEYRFNTKLTNINVVNNKLDGIEVNDDEIILCNNLFLCIGHSARDTFEMLNNVGLNMKSKPFAVGVRIIHNEKEISESMYGPDYKYLEPASYKLTYNTSEKRGVYSFCMCPGGYVVNASSENGRVAINGMSNQKRDSGASNSAIVVTVNSNDFGDKLFDGMNFQRELEEKAYKHGNGLMPAQRYEDFKLNRVTTKLGSINPITKGDITLSNLNDVLPEFITNPLKEAIPYFEGKIKGYSNPDSILLAVESRTSSPVKIERNELGISNIEGIYPTGEGAGYAGGITTAAIDGMKQAENYAKIYRP